MSKADLPLANEGEKIGEHEGLGIWQTKTYRWVQEGDAIQSVMRRDKPDELVLPTHRYMLVALALVNSPRRILNLGFGVGAFERKFAAAFPELGVTSVEASAAMLEVAENYFDAAETPVTLSSAEGFIGQADHAFDVVMVDLFAAGKNASCLYEGRFYEDLRQSVDAGACVAINLIPEDEKDLLAVLLPLRQCFAAVAMASIPERQNLILLASDHAIPNDLPSPADDIERFGFAVQDLFQQFTRLPLPA